MFASLLKPCSERRKGERRDPQRSLGNNGNVVEKRRLATIVAILFVLSLALEKNFSRPSPPTAKVQDVPSSIGNQNNAMPRQQLTHDTTQDEESYDDDDDDAAVYGDEDEEPGDEEDEDEYEYDEDADGADGGHDDEDEALFFEALTTAPTAAPTPLPIVPDELLPKLPQTPAYNFKVPKNSGCFLNTTEEAQFTNYPKTIPLNNLVQVLEAGNFRPNAETGQRKKAICKWRRVGNFMHFPHMMQEFTRCLSFFLTFPSHEPFIIRRAHRRYWYPFNMGIAKIFKWL